MSDMVGSECPLCGSNQVLRVENVKDVYPGCQWDVPENATLTCAFCHGVSIGGNWRRTDSVTERAWQLRNDTERKKNIEHYKDKLTA